MKQMDFVTKKIGDATYYIRPFPAFKAANISGELASVLAPIISGIAPLLGDVKVGSGSEGDVKEATEKATKNFLDMDIEEVIPPLSKALSQIDGDKVEHLARRLIIDYENVNVKSKETDGESVKLDDDLANEIFCRDLMDMLRLCIEVVRINFGSFFENPASLFGDQTASLLATPTTKNGEN